MGTVNRAPFIIPVFIPHQGCPHQCVFCNQTAITGQARGRRPISGEEFERHIQAYLAYKGGKRGFTEIAFFGGNFLGLERDTIVSLLAQAERFVVSGQANGIRFSTRPDTIDADRLAILRRFSVSAVELGTQSMDNHVLASSQRGHTAEDTARAVRLLKDDGLAVGLQIMAGLPGDTRHRSLASAEKAAGLQPDFVRIYPTIVLSGSRLAVWYRQGRYTPLPLDTCVSRVKEIYHIFAERSIRVIRMGLQASASLDRDSDRIAGPYHPAFGHLVYSALFLDKASAALNSFTSPIDAAAIRVHPRNISRMKGLKNSNVSVLKKKFGIRSLRITGDSGLTENAVSVHRVPPDGSRHAASGKNRKS
jgi:histone acetyltransferase (RNA polymerase elongator complex component)